jgi:hypothetical protein
VVVGDREGHQLLQRQFFLTVEIHQERADAGQFQALGDQQHRGTEPLRHFLDAAAIIDQSAEGLELIGGVHRLSHVVFGEGDFGVVLTGQYVAADRNVLGQLFALGKQFERRQSPPSGNNLIAVVRDGPHLQILQEAVGGDAGGKLVDADLASGLAYICR